MNRLLAIAAFAVAAASPLAAQPVAPVTLAPGEIELHIEALGRIPADTAVVPLQVVGHGKEAAAAKADLANKEAAVYASLARLGIPRAKIAPGKDIEPQYPVAETAYGVACDAAASPADSAAAAAAASVMGCDAVPPVATASRTLMVTVEDLNKLPEVTKLATDDNYFVSQGSFYARDPAAAHTAAVAKAITSARAEAEAYAAAMGYRVVRIIRLGNTKPEINWPDLMMLAGGFDTSGSPGSENAALYELRAMVAAHYAGAAVDFVIAPK